MNLMTVAEGMLRLARRIPTLVWAAWIVGLVVGTGALALAFRPAM